MFTEQNLPKAGGMPVHDSAVERINITLQRQNQKGLEKYGIPLSTFNGRSISRDISEEMADTLKYVEVLIQEHIYMRNLLFDIDAEVLSLDGFIDDENVLDFIRIADSTAEYYEVIERNDE